MMYYIRLVIFFISIQKAINDIQEDKSYWLKLGKEDLNTAFKQATINKKAKNVILFIGDGMGPTTITATRIYSKTERGYLSFEKFPNIGALKTYSANKLVPDSCSTATALFCGVKANQKTSGVDASVKMDDCAASLEPRARLKSIFDWAQDASMATGFVTTTRVTHATPSALYSHTPNRKWECESTIPANLQTCKDIARQLVEDLPGKNINVIMGGGRQCLQSNVSSTEDDPIDLWSCYRQDGRNLVHQWQTDKVVQNVTWAYVTNSSELNQLNTSKQFVLGIFANGHLKFDHERSKTMPSIVEMTRKSIEILSKHSEGFVLIVEGGLIDFGHHRGHARKALDETFQFSKAVSLATQMTNLQETLIVVTSDHSHSLTFSGYANRGLNVLDVAQNSKIDGLPYTSLLYGTGGPNNFQFSLNASKIQRLDPSLNDTRNFEYSQQSVVLTDEVTHSGTDVLVYAIGPMAHLFHSVHEQTYVAYVISFAAQIGPLKDLQNNCSRLVLTKYVLILLWFIKFL